MEIYECSLCHFSTTIQCNYKRHLNTKKHKLHSESSKNLPKVTEKEPEVTKNLPEESNFNCKYCSKSFTLKNAMYRHIKYRCTKNKDEDVKELTRLLNLQIENQNKQIELQQKQIDKLSSKLQIQINNIHYNLLPYRNTDTSHLTDEDFIQCVNQQNCVKLLIQKIHFNPTKPENMNVYISNLKDKYMMIYNGTWKTVHKKVLNDIVRDKHFMIQDWVEEEKYPEVKDKFMNYLQLKENVDFKEDIKLMMYNQHDTVRRLT
jgi:hypothetical protein